MTNNISELLPKKYQKIFSKKKKIFGKYFHFSDFENLKIFRFRFFSLSYRTFSDFFQFHIKNDIFEIWKMKIFPEIFQIFWKYFLIIFCGKSFAIWSFITLSNLPRWIPHNSDDISIVRISTSTDFNSYWTNFWSKSSSHRRPNAPFATILSNSDK